MRTIIHNCVYVYTWTLDPYSEGIRWLVYAQYNVALSDLCCGIHFCADEIDHFWNDITLAIGGITWKFYVTHTMVFPVTSSQLDSARLEDFDKSFLAATLIKAPQREYLSGESVSRVLV